MGEEEEEEENEEEKKKGWGGVGGELGLKYIKGMYL